MTHDRITCEWVDREDLDTRYLAGSLSAPQAQAFEAHFFACDRCWGLVHAGAEVRAAAGLPEVARIAQSPAIRRHYWVWAPLAAAAALVVWLNIRAPQTDVGAPDATVRGSSDSLAVAASATADLLRATWPRVAEASRYRVRLYSAAGDVLADLRVTDTVAAVMRDSLSGPPTGLFWQVQALDLTGAPLARSPLISAEPQPANPSP